MPKDSVNLFLTIQSGNSESMLATLADRAGTGKTRRPRQGRRVQRMIISVGIPRRSRPRRRQAQAHWNLRSWSISPMPSLVFL